MKKIASIFLLMICGCGPVSEFVKVKVNPGTEKSNAKFNLSEKLFTFAAISTLTNPRCLQKVYAGYSERAEGGGFQGFEANLTSDQFASIPSDAQSFIDTANIGTSEPIYLTLPRNKPVRVGMFGAFFASQSLVNGFCVQNSYNNSSDAFMFQAATKLFVVGDQTNINVPVQMIRATETPSPTLAENPFLHITSIPPPTTSPSYSCTGGCELSFTYGGSESNTTGITIVAQKPTTNFALSDITLPYMFPIQTKIKTSRGTFYGKICEADDGNGNGINPSGTLAFLGTGAGQTSLEGGNCNLHPGND